MCNSLSLRCSNRKNNFIYFISLYLYLTPEFDTSMIIESY